MEIYIKFKRYDPWNSIEAGTRRPSMRSTFLEKKQNKRRHTN